MPCIFHSTHTLSLFCRYTAHPAELLVQPCVVILLDVLSFSVNHLPSLMLQSARDLNVPCQPKRSKVLLLSYTFKCPLKKTQFFCPCSKALNRSSKGLNCWYCNFLKLVYWNVILIFIVTYLTETNSSYIFHLYQFTSAYVTFLYICQ
jgi:hypothetical protein